MATPSGGKFRSKRSHYSRKPYERPKPKSLLARVSDTVKDFITPSWLNNLWNNPNDDDGEGSSRSSTPELPRPDGQPSGTPNFMPSAVATSTPDINLRIGKEALSVPRQSTTETTPIVQLRDDVVRDGDRGRTGDEDDVVIVDEQQPSTSSGIKHTPLPFRNYADPIGTSTPNDDMVLLGGKKQALDKDDASDTSVSTSGCSSLVPHLDKVDHKEKLSKKNLDRLSEMGHSNSLAKSSLWTDTSSTGLTPSGAANLSASRPQQSISSAKRPSFNTSYFGSPKIVGESRPKNASPFYPGRTRFGGSSALRTTTKRLRDSPYEVHLPVKRNVRPKPAQVNVHDSIGGATSSTAKKILDTLERMSTPLLDAKKIPMSPAASPYSFRPSSRLAARAGPSRTNTPPTSGLLVAQQASIKPNKQPPVSMVIDLEKEERVSAPTSETLPTSTAGPTISTAPSFRLGAPITTSTPAIPSYDEGTSSREKTGGKMKSKSRTTMHYSAQKSEEDEVCEIPNLPEVALPLPKSLPTFSFGSSLTSPASSSTSSTTKPSSQSSSTTFSQKTVGFTSSGSIAPAQSSTSLSSVPSFKFQTSTSSSTSSSDGPQFTFASPIIKQTGSSSASSSKTSSSTTTTFKFSVPRQTPYSTSRPSASAPLGGKKPSFETPERTRRKGDDDDVVEVVDDEGYGGIKVAKELKTGSCLEAFGIVPTQNGPVPSSSTKVQAHPAKPSSSHLDNGPLLGSKKADRSSFLSNDTSKQSNSILNKFKPASSSQESDKNKDAKPTSSTSSISGLSNAIVNNSKTAAKSELDTCLAQNKGDVIKTGQSVAKPAATTSISDSKSPAIFNSLASKFSKQSNEWECDTCMIQNKDSVDDCVACTTPRPGKSKSEAKTVTQPEPRIVNNVIADKFKASAGEWECDTCMIRNKATILKCVACETPKPGSQPSLSAPPATSFKFGTSSLSNGDATGAFSFGNSATSDSLNSNTNATAGGFKFSGEISFGQKPNTADSNGGFKPSNFTLSKTNSDSSTTKTALSEAKSLESTLSGQAKSEQKLEVKVPSGIKFGACTSESSSATGGFKFGAPTGGLTFGQSTASIKIDSSIGGGFKFGQSAATAEQSQLDKEGPPPNVNLFQSKTTELDGPSAKKSFSFGAAPAASSSGAVEKKTDGAASTFTFGGSLTTKESTLNPEAPSFQFGTASGTKSGTATFGSAATTVASVTPAESKPSFTFGSTASSSASSTAPSSASTPSFTFGNSGTTKPDSAKANDVAKPGSFTFGSGLAFGAAKPQEKAVSSAGGFSFGQTPASATEKPASTAPSFSFGAAAPAPAPAATKEEPAKTFMFGSQNQNNNQGGSGFSFGAPAASTAAPAQTTPTFNFGAAANKTPAQSTTGGFNFGAAPASNTQFTGSTTTGFGGFSSNRSSTNPSPAFGAPPAASQPQSTFTFGATAATTTANSNPFGGSTTTASATPFGASAPTANPTFGSTGAQSGFGAATPTQGSVFGSGTNATGNAAFGSGLGSSSTGGPAFGASTNATPGFGSKPAPAFGSGTANATSGGFSFGKAAPTFNFGATNNTAAAPTPAQGAFQFTGNQPNQAPQVAPAATPQPAGGFNFSGATQPSLNFGGSSGTPQAGTTAFQFQASTGAGESNPFSASSTPGAQSGRKIKRAVRRNIKR